MVVVVKTSVPLMAIDQAYSINPFCNALGWMIIVSQSKSVVSISKADDGIGLTRIVRVESPEHPLGKTARRLTAKSRINCVLLMKLCVKAGMVPVFVWTITPEASLTVQM